ncbi:hypothetical protein HDU93_000187 [Gonapodya sp. JEL0774]|nr:hypothetical protein HDU93_000187 [Gonapodya sp. JEL0774]
MSLTYRNFSRSSAPSFVSLVRPFLSRDPVRNNHALLGLEAVERDGADLMGAVVDETGTAVAVIVNHLPHTPVLIGHPLKAEPAAVLVQGLVDSVGLSVLVGKFMWMSKEDVEIFKGACPALKEDQGVTSARILVNYRISRDLPETYPSIDPGARTPRSEDMSTFRDWNLGFLKDTGVPPPPDPSAKFDRIMADQRVGRMVLYREEDVPVPIPLTMAYYYRATSPSIPRITSVYTPPAHRNCGYAYRLVTSVVRKIFMEQDVEACMLLADPGAGAWRVYEKAGFVKFSETITFRVLEV